MKRLYRNIVAKTERNHPNRYLPLWMHTRDAVGTMCYLIDHWLPESIISMTGLSRREFRRLTIFCTANHDIGKVSHGFQAVIFAVFRQVKAMLAPLELTSLTERTPLHRHTLVGAAILNELGVRDYVVSIVGAHHGKIMDLPNFGNIMKAPYNLYGDDADAEIWKALWRECMDEALAQAGYASLEEVPANLSQPAQMLMIALVILADWLASSTTLFPLVSVESEPDDNIYPARVKRATQEMKNFLTPWQPGEEWRCDDIFKKRFGYEKPNAVQAAMAKVAEHAAKPGLFILEAPMGIGKTEAALLAGEILANRQQTGGLAIFMPTQATTNAMFDRIVNWLHHMPKINAVWDDAADACESGQLTINLVHGKAKLNETVETLMQGNLPILYDEEDETKKNQDTTFPEGLAINSFFMGRKTQLLADFVVGTVDQLLMGALKQKHLMLRHLGLAGKTIIVDEIHAYDAYMTRYLDVILNWLGVYHTPVILLSATLPGQRRAELVGAYLGNESFAEYEALKNERAYPLLTWTDGQTVHTQQIAMEKHTTSVHILRAGDDALIPFLKERMREGGCAGIIVNTVKRAQQIAAWLKEAMPDKEIVLDHAQFVMPDRLRREKELMARLGRRSTSDQRNGLIVVGTQVLEQSLDIDFDVLITDLCPMDLLLQRLGRLHRHQERQRPAPLREATCLVLGTETMEGGAKAIYGEYLLTMTAALLPEVIHLPEDISPLVQDTYGEDFRVLREKPEGIEKQKGKYDEKKRGQARRAKDNCIPLAELEYGERPSEHLLHGVMTDMKAYNEAQEQVSVRDGSSSIEVLVLQYGEDGFLHTVVPGENELNVLPDAMPSAEETRMMTRQSLRLPHQFSSCWKEEKQTINELENLRQEKLQAWMKSPQLSRELFLLLDQHGDAALAKKRVHYDSVYGLCVEDDENGGQGV